MSIKYPFVALEIMGLVYRDESIRLQIGKAEDIEYVKESFHSVTLMKRIIEKDLKGWPTISKVGKDAAHGAYTIALHADHDPNFQQMCLQLMELSDPGEFSPVDAAILRARCASNYAKLGIFPK